LNILITVPRLPFPLNSGGRIAIYNTIRSLSKYHKLTLVIIDDDKRNIQYIDELRVFSDSIFFFGKSKFSCYFNSLCGLFSRKPLQVGYFYFKDVQKLINEIHQSHDLFFAFMIRTTSYGLSLKISKINYAIDSMYLNYLNSFANSTSLIWRLIYKIEIPLLFNYEKYYIKMYNSTTYVNKEEALFWLEFGRTMHLPHGVENSLFNYNRCDENFKNVVSFVGRMDYQPNIDAVKWFCSNVMTHVDKSICFYIIGGFPTSEILELESNNIKVLGFVEDPYIILKSSICSVSPMQTGGGLQTKILISMALGCIVVSTSNSASSIDDALNNKNIIVEDDPVKMAMIINDIYFNQEAYLNIKKESVSLAFNNYSEECIENKLFNLVKEFDL
jgi:glycosyltransferase involved in cell wall biosynthesis